MEILTQLKALATALVMLSTALASAPDSYVQQTDMGAVTAPLTIHQDVEEIVPTPNVGRTIKCESQWKNVTIIDSNGKHSRGIGQFQDETWQWFSNMSGITGTSTDPVATVKMMNWAFAHGYASHWTCARKLGITR